MKVYRKFINHTKVALIFNTPQEAKDFYNEVELIQSSEQMQSPNQKETET